MSNHYFKGLIFSVLACAAPVAQAELVSADDAKALAAEFFGAGINEKLASPDALELIHTRMSAENPLYYVFNARDGKAYIIMSADDCTTPVLAYSLEGSYDASALPPAMQWMMNSLETEIKAAPDLQKPMTSDVRRKMVRRNATGQPIYLKTASWSQEAPFNSKIPGNPLTGCVGTAMSIIMKYHEFPERGTGSYNGVNFDVAYDWDNMLDDYKSGCSTTQAEAVGTLFYHAATSIGTQFGYSGSSAYEVKVPVALVNYFGYDPGVSFRKRSETRSQAEFDQIVENEIRAGRPVLYCGQDMTMGHAFVVDGFNPLNNMIHVNWGWAGHDGNNNGGWYASTALNPTVSQSHNFSYLTTVIYNIKPGNGNNAAWSPLHITADGAQTGMGSDLTGDLTAGRNFTVRVGNLKNLSYENFSGKITVGLFGSDGAFKAALSKIDNFSLDGMAIFSRAYTDFSCALPAGVSVADGDMIRMATSADDGATWKPVAGELLTTNEIPARGAAPKYFSVRCDAPASGASFTGDSRVIRGWDYSFKVVPANPDNDVITVKANGYIITPGADYNYRISNVLADQDINIYVQNAADVKEKRSIWVGEPGTLETILSGPDAANVKDLTLFGTIDARDFTFMRTAMKLTRLDMTGVRIVAYQANQANAIPREAFRGLGQLKEILLPNSVTRFNNGAFRYAGIERIVIPAGVNTYEYNVFNGCAKLREVWVKNPNPVFVNWCVFIGCPTNRTIYCPDEASRDRYIANEYWHNNDTDRNVNVELAGNNYPDPADLAFDVMEDAAVKFTCDTKPGRYAAGKKVTFAAEYALQDDNRMEVYANSTLLKPDAAGNYSVDINANTIIHFDIIEPASAYMGSSAWTITDDGGTVGMLTDAVNVFPGVPFTIRINTFEVKETAFWAAVLTTADGRIKEFISPISAWSSGIGKGYKMNVNCCVNEATVREGNLIRMATSYNKKTWSIVEGINQNVVAALPAINNQTPVYNFTFPDNLEAKANVSGLVASAVRGRDLAFKITPKSARDRINMSVNGKAVHSAVASVSYNFIAKEDLNFDIEVFTPEAAENVTYNVTPGTLKGMVNPNNIAPSVTIIGEVYASDLKSTFQQKFFQTTVKQLDLSQVVIKENGADPANTLPTYLFYSGNSTEQLNQETPVLVDVKLPKDIVKISQFTFNNCANIKELTLPEALYNGVDIEDKAALDALYGLERRCFQGCDALTTLYVPCRPRHIDNCKYNDCRDIYIVSHINQGPHNSHFSPSYQDLGFGRKSEGRNAKITVVVNPEDLDVYLSATPGQLKDENESKYCPFNYWLGMGFNIVGQYPVFGVNFDASRCFIADPEVKDITKVASFLGDNVPLESIDFSGKLFVGALAQGERPEGVEAYKEGAKIKVFDNGKLMPDDAIAPDGSINLTFYNPNKHRDTAGNHNIEVTYLYDVRFKLASANLTVVPDIHNNGTTEFEVMNTADAASPVLENVRENSTVRFKVELANVDLNQITGIVKQGEHVIPVDDEGYYNIDVTDDNMEVSIYAVPRNGAVLTAEHLDVIDAAEATDVTSISLAGEIEPEKVTEVIKKLPSLEELDLSGLSSPLEANAMAGNTTLTTVVLPAAEYIEEGTFKGCSNLSAVAVPECVNVIAKDAFAGCSSLETLSFTGIQSIGDNAFFGCSNLTTIIFNNQVDNAPRKVQRRVETARTEGYSDAAFSGLNPNCLVYLDEGQSAPAGVKANYIKVKTVINGDGVKERVYKADGSIALDPAYSFDAVNTFSLAEGAQISLEMDLQKTSDDGKAGWKPLLLPFAPTMVVDANGQAIEQYADKDAKVQADKQYFLAGMPAQEAGNEDFVLATDIKANTPYLAAMHKSSNAGPVRFVAENVEVAATPDDIRTAGVDFALLGSFGYRSLDPSTTFTLNSDGSAFTATTAAPAADNAEETPATTEVAPFNVYIEAPTAQGRVFNIDIDAYSDVATGIDQIDDNAKLRIVSKGGILTIYAPVECDVKVYAVDGRLIDVLHLNQGANTISTLPHGVYIINGEKIVH